MIWIFADIYTGVPSITISGGGHRTIADLTFILYIFSIHKSFSTNIDIEFPGSTYVVASQILCCLYCAIFVLLISAFNVYINSIFSCFSNSRQFKSLITHRTCLNFIYGLLVLLTLCSLTTTLEILISSGAFYITIRIPISEVFIWAELWGATFLYWTIIILSIILLIMIIDIYLENPASPIIPIYLTVVSLITCIATILRQFTYFVIVLISLNSLLVIFVKMDIPALIEIHYMTITTSIPKITLWVNLYGTTFGYCVIAVLIIMFAHKWCNFVYHHFINSETLITFIRPMVLITIIRSIAFLVLIVIIALIAPMPLEFYIPIVASLLFILILPIIAITTPEDIITGLTFIALWIFFVSSIDTDLIGLTFLMIFLFPITCLVLLPFKTPITPLIHVAVWALSDLIFVLGLLLLTTDVVHIVSLTGWASLIVVIILLLVIINSWYCKP